MSGSLFVGRERGEVEKEGAAADNVGTTWLAVSPSFFVTPFWPMRKRLLGIQLLLKDVATSTVSVLNNLVINFLSPCNFGIWNSIRYFGCVENPLSIFPKNKTYF